MPRPDGTLYNFEKAALNKPPPPPPQPKRPRGRPKGPPKPPPEPKPPRPPHPLDPSVFMPDDAARLREIEGALAPGQPGRPPAIKATPLLVKQVCDDIRGGLPEESALIKAGISRKGIERWKEANPTVQLLFDQAEVDFENRLVRLLASKAAGDVKAAQWLLERRNAARWAPISKAEVTGKGGGAIQHQTLSHVLLASVGRGGEGDPVESAKVVNSA